MHKLIAFSSLTFLCGVIATFAQNVNEDALPDATSFARVEAGPASDSTSALFGRASTSVTSGDNFDIVSIANTNFDEFGGPGWFTPEFSASASIQQFADEAFASVAVGEMTYDIRLDGPSTKPVLVDFDIFEKVDLQLNYGSTAVATLSADVATNILGFGTNGNGQLLTLISTSGNKSQSQILNLPNGTVFLTPGETYEIGLNASIQLQGRAAPPTNGNSLPSLLATAGVDPVFSVDPSVPNLSEYSFELSPNLASVPEPNATVLLLTGVGLFALLRLTFKPVAGI
jgi:hypothetical protein